MKVVVYGTGCPQCNVLEAKLKQKGISYASVTDEDEIERVANDNGIMSMPILQVDDTFMAFPKAIKWVEATEL